MNTSCHQIQEESVRVSECVVISEEGELPLHTNQVGASGVTVSPRYEAVWPGALNSAYTLSP